VIPELLKRYLDRENFQFQQVVKRVTSPFICQLLTIHNFFAVVRS
jgi:hypothetical protein